ncbi:hypothetical protein [Lacticaseibacillus pantheris]|uniref:hypothetical protein n=1 Tax=Lacticaseibacillus pantheris TaxID=171523 RepID=UPI0006D2AC28|nr:hypothetical protein [Lacticaseibacillus pantheris]
MQYKQLGQTLYLRVDKGEEILTQILKVCADAGVSLPLLVASVPAKQRYYPRICQIGMTSLITT